jgi:protein gp37
MALLKKNSDGWWDATWNTMFGCRRLSKGCRNCYAARNAATLHSDLDVPLYRGTTKFKGGRYLFNGVLRDRPTGDPEWTFPVRWKGSAHPSLGPGMPSLIFVGDMTEIFLPDRPKAVIDRTFGTLVSSAHIGQVLTKLPERMVEYILAQPMIKQQRWQQKLWVGFSAEDQASFDLRWPAMRALAGWTIFVSVAPMLGPVRLPSSNSASG